MKMTINEQHLEFAETDYQRHLDWMSHNNRWENESDIERLYHLKDLVDEAMRIVGDKQ